MTRQEFTAKSVIIGRKPRVAGDTYKTAFIKIYSCLDPLSVDGFPDKEFDVPNTQKVVLHTSPVEYYLEGNDLVYDNITKIILDIEDSVIHVHIQ